jgi:DNA-binding response OmpR family regulator
MKKKILIAEDNASISLLLQHLLSNEYEVVTTTNGGEALTWLGQGYKPDVIIADIMMPEIDGWKLLQNIKASAFLSTIPIMMLSGLETSTERIKCFELGADEYMIKPFSPQELTLRIANLINRSKYVRA